MSEDHYDHKIYAFTNALTKILKNRLRESIQAAKKQCTLKSIDFLNNQQLFQMEIAPELEERITHLVDGSNMLYSRDDALSAALAIGVAQLELEHKKMADRIDELAPKFVEQIREYGFRPGCSRNEQLVWEALFEGYALRETLDTD